MPPHNGKSASIVVVGSSNTDLIVRVDRIPRVGETVLGGTFHTANGGKGANQAVAAAAAGAEVTFVSRIGKDAFGGDVVRRLESAGINVSHVTRDANGPSGVGLIFVGSKGENSIAVASGVNDHLSARDVLRAKKVFSPGSILLVQLEAPLTAVTAAINLAASSEIRVILNPAPARPLPDSLLKKVDILTPNEHEAEALTGVRVNGAASVARAAVRLRERGVKVAIITLGSRGAFVSSPEGHVMIPAFKVRPVDTTGAGDVFNGSLAAALAEGYPLLDAVRFGQAAAAISVTRVGAQSSVPHRAEVEKFLLSRR